MQNLTWYQLSTNVWVSCAQYEKAAMILIWFVLPNNKEIIFSVFIISPITNCNFIN